MTNFFQRIAATALSAAIVTFGAAAPGYAHHSPEDTRQEWNDAQFEQLWASARAVGIQIFTEFSDRGAAEACRERGLLGMMTSEGQLLLCVGNHGGDQRELADTFRHELVHGAQFCNGGEMLFPETAEDVVAFARDYLHMPMESYDPELHPTEAEARVMAHFLEEEEVGALLDYYCNPRNQT